MIHERFALVAGSVLSSVPFMADAPALNVASFRAVSVARRAGSNRGAAAIA
jgi:hypothetical protein